MDVQAVTAITTSIATSTVAFLVAAITYLQWVTNRARLKHELFERRYDLYRVVAVFLAEVCRDGGVAEGLPEKFLRETRQVYFVFNCDPSVKRLVSKIYHNALDLQTLAKELDGSSGDERKNNVHRQTEIKNWFGTTLERMEQEFKEYLCLGH